MSISYCSYVGSRCWIYSIGYNSKILTSDRLSHGRHRVCAALQSLQLVASRPTLAFQSPTAGSLHHSYQHYQPAAEFSHRTLLILSWSCLHWLAHILGLLPSIRAIGTLGHRSARKLGDGLWHSLSVMNHGLWWIEGALRHRHDCSRVRSKWCLVLN